MRKRWVGLIFMLLLATFLRADAHGSSDLEQAALLVLAKKLVYTQPDSAQKCVARLLCAPDEVLGKSLHAELLLVSSVSHALLGENDLSWHMLQQAHVLFGQLGHMQGLVECKLNIGENLYNRGKFDEALAWFLQAEQLAVLHGMQPLKAKSLRHIGKYYHSLGDFSRSFGYYMSALGIAAQCRDTLEMMSASNKIGKYYETLGNYPKALEYCLKAETLGHSVNNLVEQATTFNSLGNICRLLKEYPKAVAFHRQALNTRKKLNYLEGEAKSLNNLGEVWLDMGQHDSARRCLLLSLKICEQIGYSKGIVKSQHNLGLLDQKQGNGEAAILKFHRVMALSTSMGYDKGIAEACFALASLYRARGALSQSVALCKKGLALANRENVLSEQMDFYLLLSHLSQSTGNYKDALAYYQQYSQVKDQVVSLESNNKISELKAEYELSVHNRTHEMLVKDNEITKLNLKRNNLVLLFAGIVLSLLVALLCVFYGRIVQKKLANRALTILNNDIRTKNIELDGLNQKLEVSRKQQIRLFGIISHELRNPLFWFRNLIQVLTLRIDVLDKEMVVRSLDSLNESATHTFHLMDNLLHWSRSQLGSLKCVPEPLDMGGLIDENVRLIASYAAHKQIHIAVDADRDLVVHADKTMIQTVLRNLLSNAVKFTSARGRIDVVLHKRGQSALVEVRDNGVGMSMQSIEQILNNSGINFIPGVASETGSGLGLAITKEFVELHEGVLCARSMPGDGTVFSFDLPLFFAGAGVTPSSIQRLPEAVG